jgi:hypothetical protein
MNEPLITWYVKDNPRMIQLPLDNAEQSLTDMLAKAKNGTLEDYISESAIYVPYKEYFAGSFRPNEVMEIQMQVWNNKWGQEDVENIANGIVSVYFDCIENSALLCLCTLKIGNGGFVPFVIEGNKGKLGMNRILYGTANSGSDSAVNNYETITLRIGPISKGIKDELKNLFIDIEYGS